MFFLRRLTHTINLHPSFFGPSTAQFLQSKLHSDVEGVCSGRYGFIISVVDIETVGQGTIQHGTGMATFDVVYQAIVYRPFRGEVVDAVVSSVNKMGFFAEVGPLPVFVSAHHMPNDYSFDPISNPVCYTSSDDNLPIAKGTRVRIKIAGTRVDATEIFAIATMREDYLGPQALIT